MSTGNEAAFPQSYPDDPTQPVWADNTLSRGLTKREWFAGKALQGMLTDGFVPTGIRPANHAANGIYDYPQYAVAIADRLLAELAK
jgi:hypothetical protein